jgi:hypothetical protein
MPNLPIAAEIASVMPLKTLRLAVAPEELAVNLHPL